MSIAQRLEDGGGAAAWAPPLPLLYVSTSRPFFRMQVPLTDDFERVDGTIPLADPNLFQDEDGRVYLYGGCSNTTPLWGVELDPRTMAPIGERRDLITATAHITWDGAEGARGYNVRHGLSPEKLYHGWAVYDQTTLVLSTLNAGQQYWVVVDAFDENGVTPGACVTVR